MSSFEDKCVNTIRLLAADTVQKANSGHPGAPMGCAPMAHVLFSKVMNFSPSDAHWPNRDRFILSNGHGCALLYSMLHLTGYPHITMDQLKQFRQLGSLTPGHPENFITPGVEVSTGPLGQGISNAVGFAIAERHLAALYNRPGHTIVDNRTYVICGDGCLMEGVSAEAASLAGHLGLGNLTVLWDDNHISIDGETHLAFTEDVRKRYESYGWQVISVANGNSDYAAIEAAITLSKAEKNRPTLIAVTTTIGFGSKKEGTEKVHGSPLGAEDIAFVKQKWGFDPSKTFHVDEDVAAYYLSAKTKGDAKAAAWREAMDKYAAAFPAEAADFRRRMTGELPAGWEAAIPHFADGNKDATRKSGQAILNALAAKVPDLVGGSADLNPSTFTYIDASTDFQKATPAGRNIRFGVREHAMAAVCNGLAAYGGFIPYCSTFLTFVGYAYGSIRVSALSHSKVVYIMTHDSIGLGEDGPTHQPVEVLSLLRSTPNMLVLRPADANETAGAYKAALSQTKRPSTIALSRQSAPHVPGTSAEGVAKGAYVVSGAAIAKPSVVLVGTGTELKLCADAAAGIEGARVVSFPSWELFNEQPEEYRRSVFPKGVPILAVEAGVANGWSRYSHAQVCMRGFGASAPDKDLFKHFGFTAENVSAKAKSLIKHFEGKEAPETDLIL